MSDSPFERLRARVLADAALQQRLLAVADSPAFLAEVQAVAGELGLTLERTELEARLRQAQQAWLLRWAG